MNFTMTTLSPADFKQHIQKSAIFYSHYQTIAGNLILLSTETGIFDASFSDENNVQNHKQYFFKPDIDLTKILLVGTNFQCKVWRELLKIPAGTISTYQNLAQTIQQPNAWRAVANALANNKIAYFIPCHRVIRKNGHMGGYKWGIEKKLALLKAEKITF